MKSLCEAIVIVALLCPVSGAEAQSARRSAREYVTIPFDGDLEQILRERLQQSQEWDEILKHMPPQLKPLTPALEKLKDNEKFRELLRDLLKKEAVKDGKWPEALKNFEKAIKKEIEKRKIPPVGKPPPPDQVKNSVPAQPPRSDTPAPAKPRVEKLDDRFNRWVKDWLKEAQDSNLGDMLRDSPAWRQTVEELKQSLGKMTPEGDRWTELLDRWPLLEKLRLPALDIETRLPALSLPDLPNVALSIPRIRIENPLDGVRVPNLPAPSFLTEGYVALWLLAVAAVAFGLWQVLKSLARNQKASGNNWSPGPWPMSPMLVATRADLVRCFDYLSLLLLGKQARSWNHRNIAEHLVGQEGSRRRVAQELASIYEWARYAPGDGPLPPGEAEKARQALVTLGQSHNASRT